MSLRDIEADVTVLHDAIVHEAEDEFSKAAGGAAVRLLGNFFADIHRLADAQNQIAHLALEAEERRRNQAG